MREKMLQRYITRVLWCSLVMTLFETCDSFTEDSGEEPYILLGNRNTIQWISLDGGESISLINNTDYDVIGVDYDIREGWMLWTDVASRTVNKANLDGSNRTILVDNSMRVPDGLAWDWATKKVYWSDAGRKRIEVYDPQRDVRRLLKSTGSQSLPRDIAVDPTTGWLFWTDWGGSPKVERMSMDGTAHTTIISTDIVWPSGLAIDYQTHTLFWSDASLDKLESSDFDGQHRQILFERQFIFYPFGLAFFNSTLYWGDWVVGFVFRLSVIDPTDYNYVAPVLESEPTGLRVVSELNQPHVETPCRTANGECSHLCLISATSPAGFSCACPRHFRLAQNQRDCYSGKQGSGPTTPPTEVLPAKGSCARANYTTCCTSGDCQGFPPVCACNTECHSLGTCCPDIETICPSAQGYLVVANENGIVRLGLDGRSQSALVRGETHTAAIDYDISSNFIYWSDVVLGRIRRSFLNGSNATTIIGSGRAESPEGLAVDWVNKMLYWTDARAKKIEVFDLEKGHRGSLITTGEDTLPRTIIVDPTTRWLYWSDWGERALIERASMDGQQRQAIVSSNLVWPNGLTIDIKSQTLYWADAMLDKIEAANADGTNRHVLTTLGIFHPFSLTVHQSQLYWSDWEMDIILTGSSDIYLNSRLLARLNGSRPMGIKAVSTINQPSVANPCLTNASCSHMCLLSSISANGFTCVCPHGWKMKDNSTSQCINLQHPGPLRSEGKDEVTLGTAKTDRSLTVKSPKQTVVHGTSQDFKLEVLPLGLMAVIILLSVIVIVMFAFLIVRLRRARQRKRISFLERRCIAIPNIYSTPHSEVTSLQTSNETSMTSSLSEMTSSQTSSIQ